MDSGAFRHILELVSDAVFVSGPDARIVYANPAFVALAGEGHAQLEEALGGLVRNPGCDPQVLPAMLAALAQGRAFSATFPAVRASGEAFRGELRLQPIAAGDAAGGVIGILRDVTADRHAEPATADLGELTAAMLALEESEKRFRIIADTVSDVLWDVNYETGEAWITPDCAERLDLDPARVSLSHRLWFDHVAPADRERIANSWAAALASDATSWEAEYQLIGRSGQAIEVAVKASLMRHPDGTAYRVLGNLRDVTWAKRRQEGHTRSRALEAVGQLTGGVAHHFNNLLMIIQGNAELLRMSALAPEDVESVALIGRAAESAATLTRHLLAFAGQTRFDAHSLDLASFLGSLWPLLRAGLPEGVSITASISEDIRQPDVDASSLEQALVNLAMNARDAMPLGGEIEVVCANYDAPPEATPAAPDLAPGRYVVIAVRDSGPGMPASVRARAFEPYFTTKDIGKGTGLGLSMVYGFAAQSGGTATIDSEEGRGTTVSLYLPVSADDCPAPAASEGGAAAAASPGAVPASRRILVVEDQPEVRAHVVKLLTRFGYAVASAGNGVEALAMLKAGETFDLLYTDIIMPGGMNGQELSRAAAAVAPGMKVLFTSGYPAEAFEHLGLGRQDEINILRKPYKARQLEDAIARTLAA